MGARYFLIGTHAHTIMGVRDREEEERANILAYVKGRHLNNAYDPSSGTSKWIPRCFLYVEEEY